MSAPTSVRHEPEAGRFVAEVEGRRALLEYQRRGGLIVFTHTFVPPELRGRGLAEQLVRAGLSLAQAEGVSVEPACSYVATFIERHPEFRPLRSGLR